jgi:hypothetical protein
MGSIKKYTSMLVLSIRTANRLNKFVLYVGLSEQTEEMAVNLLEQAKHGKRQGVIVRGAVY